MESTSLLAEIERLRGCLERYERDTQYFLDGAIHDFRAAHRGVSISMEMLLSALPPQLDAEVTSSIRELQNCVSKMHELLNGVTNYCRCASTSSYIFAEVHTETTLELALASLDREIRDAKAVLTHGPLPKITGDAWRLTELFRHLVSNSLKYRSAAPPRIEIRAEMDSDKWCFSVQDNGIGIDPKYWAGLFRPFRRLHGSEIPGLGLGLSICRKIVEAHRGNISVESAIGQGTSFIFDLPAR